MKERISVKQMTILVMFTIVGDTIIFIPAQTAAIAKQDSLLSACLSLLLGLGIGWIIWRLSLLLENSSFFEFNRSLLGKWIGSCIFGCYLFYFLLTGAAVVRNIGNFLVTHIMPQTPIRALLFILLITIVWTMKHGLETIARSGELLFPLAAVLFVMLIAFLLPDFNWSNMMPVLGEGVSPVLFGGIVTSGVTYGELIVIVMILPLVKREKNKKRDFFLGIALGGVVLTTITGVSILVLGQYLTSKHIYPSYAMARKISIGHFLERMEVILAINWIITSFFKSVIYYYGFVTGLSQWVKVPDYRLLIFPCAFLIYGISFLLAPNVVYFNLIGFKYWPYWDMTMAVLLPLALLAIHAVKRKKRLPA
ncbi:endospore germination permease [Cohnella faecalis]|nr:endospore germination permease [Cohnella faecalis]